MYPMLRHLLWIDSGAGLLGGATMLALSAWLTDLYALPRQLLLTMGVANLLYGTYSGLLASRRRRPYGLIVLLVLANATWAIGCLVLTRRFAATASGFGLAHLVGEGLIVGGLAALEWRVRAQLSVTR